MSRSSMACALVLCVTACDAVGPGDDGPPQSQLTAVERSATTIRVQWQAIGNASAYTVDYFDEYDTCDFPPLHGDQLPVTATAVTITGLTPGTLYQVHVHELPGRQQSTNLILIRTLAAGSATQPVAAADYTICD